MLIVSDGVWLYYRRTTPTSLSRPHAILNTPESSRRLVSSTVIAIKDINGA